jgi:hypothetical protein
MWKEPTKLLFDWPSNTDCMGQEPEITIAWPRVIIFDINVNLCECAKFLSDQQGKLPGLLKWLSEVQCTITRYVRCLSKLIIPSAQSMPNNQRFLSVASFSPCRTPPKTSPPNLCELPHVQATNQRRCLPAHFKYTEADSHSQILFVVTTRALVTSDLTSKNNTLLCRRRHHASENQLFSRHGLSAMYPGVMSVVWRSDAIHQVGLDGSLDTVNSFNKNTSFCSMTQVSTWSLDIPLMDLTVWYITCESDRIFSYQLHHIVID